MWKDILGLTVIAAIVVVAGMLLVASLIEWYFSLLAL
jgi:hypothetical protein